MTVSHKRHDISDKTSELLEPHLPGRARSWGGVAKDNRLFINAVFWILSTGAPWRNLPADYGDWNNTHRRFSRWRDSGHWENLLNILIEEPDYQWLMIDATHYKVHLYATGVQGGNQTMSQTKGTQHQNTFGRGCAWYAAQSPYYKGFSGILHKCCRINFGF